MHLSRAHRASVVAGNSAQPRRYGGPQAHPLPSIHGSLREYVTQLQVRAHGECADLLRQKHIVNVREPLQDHVKMPHNREEHEFELRYGRDIPRCGTLVVPRFSDDKTGNDERVVHVLIVQELQRTCLTVDMRWDAGQGKMQEALMWRELVSQIEDLMACHGACRAVSGDASASLNLALQWHLTASIAPSVGGVRSDGVSKVHRDRFKNPHEVLLEQHCARQRLRGNGALSFTEECRRSYPSMSITHMSRVYDAQIAHGTNEGVHVTFKCALVRFTKIPRAAHYHIMETIAREGGFVADSVLDIVKQTVGPLVFDQIFEEEFGRLSLIDWEDDNSKKSPIDTAKKREEHKEEEAKKKTEEEEEKKAEEEEEKENEKEEEKETEEEEEDGEVSSTPEEADGWAKTRAILAKMSSDIQAEADAIEQARLEEEAERERERAAAEEAERKRVAAKEAERKRVAEEAEERAAEKAKRERVAAEEAEKRATEEAEVARANEKARLARKADDDIIAKADERLQLAKKAEEDDDSNVDEPAPVAVEGEVEQPQQEVVRSVGQAEVDKWSQDFAALVNDSNPPSYENRVALSPPAIISAATIGQDLYPADLREKIRDRLTNGDRSTNLFAIVYDSVHPTNTVTMQLAEFAAEMDEFARKLPSNLMDLHNRTMNFITSTDGLNYRTRGGKDPDFVRAQTCPIAFDVVYTTFLTSYIVVPVIQLFYKQLEEASKTFDQLSEVQITAFTGDTEKLADTPNNKGIRHFRTKILDFKNAVDSKTRQVTDQLNELYRIDGSTVNQETFRLLGLNSLDNSGRVQLPNKHSMKDSDILQNFSVIAELVNVEPIEVIVTSFTGKSKGIRMKKPVETRLRAAPLVPYPLKVNWKDGHWERTRGGNSAGDILDVVTNAVLRVARRGVLTDLRVKKTTLDGNYAWRNHIGGTTNRVTSTEDLTKYEEVINGHYKRLVANRDIGTIDYLNEKNTPTYRLCYLQRILSITDALLRPGRLVPLINKHFGITQLEAVIGGEEPNYPLKHIDTPEKYLQMQTFLIARIYVIQIVRAQYSMHKVFESLSNALLKSDGEFQRVFGDGTIFKDNAVAVQTQALGLFDSAINHAYDASTKDMFNVTFGWTQGVLCHMEANPDVADDELFAAARRDLSRVPSTSDLIEQVVDAKQLVPDLVPKFDKTDLNTMLYMKSFAPSSSSSSSSFSLSAPP